MLMTKTETLVVILTMSASIFLLCASATGAVTAENLRDVVLAVF